MSDPLENERRRRPWPDAAPMIARESTTYRQHADRRAQRQPQTFGLTPRELYAHAVELYASGWSVDEIRSVLALPGEVLR